VSEDSFPFVVLLSVSCPEATYTASAGVYADANLSILYIYIY
jgi:hypothetical protein